MKTVGVFEGNQNRGNQNSQGFANRLTGGESRGLRRPRKILITQKNSRFVGKILRTRYYIV